ncbi:hypothetical protein DACRYDRAFT_14246 [Dacryopinax primogenitus]|uniref:Uncharacterized protein n=1 Tax=Dacryopinax primogenitus (strain DJM 731) TaxID=1858805 RepID=M5G5P9_DACPD|nr:uncharacterized protein DACRYDRAFT_14246 [Dacryopinax primogenitus]EJU04034.1 hypothetical protein DACRYDRAFT_14246 [Dacryopinax primogenitus]
MGDDAPYSSPLFSRPGPSSNIGMLTDLSSPSLTSQQNSQRSFQDPYASLPLVMPNSSESSGSYLTPLKGSQAATTSIYGPTPRRHSQTDITQYMHSLDSNTSNLDTAGFVQERIYGAPLDNSQDIQWDPTPPITDALAATLDGDDMHPSRLARHARVSSDGATLFDEPELTSQEQYWKSESIGEDDDQWLHQAEPFLQAAEYGAFPASASPPPIPFSEPPIYDMPPASFQPSTQDVYASRLLRYASAMDPTRTEIRYAPKLSRPESPGEALIDEMEELMWPSPL